MKKTKYKKLFEGLIFFAIFMVLYYFGDVSFWRFILLPLSIMLYGNLFVLFSSFFSPPIIVFKKRVHLYNALLFILIFFGWEIIRNDFFSMSWQLIIIITVIAALAGYFSVYLLKEDDFIGSVSKETQDKLNINNPLLTANAKMNGGETLDGVIVLTKDRLVFLSGNAETPDYDNTLNNIKNIEITKGKLHIPNGIKINGNTQFNLSFPKFWKKHIELSKNNINLQNN
jgi:hypothetical protein